MIPFPISEYAKSSLICRENDSSYITFNLRSFEFTAMTKVIYDLFIGKLLSVKFLNIE